MSVDGREQRDGRRQLRLLIGVSMPGPFGPAAAALFAVALSVGIVASAAAAPPEYGRCLEHAGGKWSNEACSIRSKPGAERFEWYPYSGKAANGEEKPIAKKQFKIHANTERRIKLEGTGEYNGLVKREVICKNQTAEGELTGLKTLKAFNIVFTGCESGGSKCRNEPSSPEGEIKVNELEGELVVAKWGEESGKEVPGKDKLAIRYKPKESAPFTYFICDSLEVFVRNAVLGPIITNKMMIKATGKFTATGGNQTPECALPNFSVKVCTESIEEVLETRFEPIATPKRFEESGLTLTTIQENEETWEANSVA